MLSEAGMLEYRPVYSSMDRKSKLLPDHGELLDNPGRYKRLVGKLNYVIVAQPNGASMSVC